MIFTQCLSTSSSVIQCTRITHPTIHNYTLNSQVIEVAEQHSYLGIMLNKSLSWSSHISTISSKATRTLNFLKRNLSNCSRKVKESAYLTMVRPQMEYASAVWDPHHNSLIQLLEKVQRRAARWIFNDYSRFSSVSAMLTELSWPSLQTRHKTSRLKILYKILNHQLAISIPSYYLPSMRATRSYPLHYIIPSSSTKSYQYSFFSKSIAEWNTFPLNIIETSDPDTFTSLLLHLMHDSFFS